VTGLIPGAEDRARNMPVIGQHLLIDFYEVEAGVLTDPGLMSRCLADAACRGGLTPLGPPVLHRFPGGGLTGYLLLSESHLAVHTYPEFGYAALDLFSCGSGDPAAALAALRAALTPGRERLTVVSRGTEC
jgi:S-adenosylmethionine decarboxylase